MKLPRQSILAVALTLISGGASAAIAAGGSDEKEKREILAEHETISTFDGAPYHQCMGRTALCPDKCGHSGEVASFTIVHYIRHVQNSKYGEKQQSYQVQISDTDKKPIGDPAIAKTVSGLQKGDFVRLCWRHEYVTKEGASYPERPIVKLEKLSKEEAEAIMKAPESPVPDPNAKPKEAREAEAAKKIEFEIPKIDENGLRGPDDGKVSVSYEFAIPNTEECKAEVKAIDPSVEFMQGSRGRVGAGEGQCLCIGSTHQKNWREVLRKLSELAYVKRIIECHFE